MGYSVDTELNAVCGSIVAATKPMSERDGDGSAAPMAAPQRNPRGNETRVREYVQKCDSIELEFVTVLSFASRCWPYRHGSPVCKPSYGLMRSGVCMRDPRSTFAG